jgi:hypothetical protein
MKSTLATCVLHNELVLSDNVIYRRTGLNGLGEDDGIMFEQINSNSARLCSFWGNRAAVVLTEDEAIEHMIRRTPKMLAGADKLKMGHFFGKGVVIYHDVDNKIAAYYVLNATPAIEGALGDDRTKLTSISPDVARKFLFKQA